MVPVEILLIFRNYFRALQSRFKNFFQELWFFITKYALYGSSFYRPIRFDQSPKPLIPPKIPLDSTVFLCNEGFNPTSLRGVYECCLYVLVCVCVGRKGTNEPNVQAKTCFFSAYIIWIGSWQPVHTI